MEKMRMESLDMTAQNIEKIGALFPNCITETVDENGKPKKAINFDLLKQMLSGDVIEGSEAYEFTWVGKKAAIVEANKPIRKTLRPCKEESVNWDTTENLYIEGDNLEVLKLLQESYLGAVKMIYIDPPYNTGNDSFVYPDDYTMDKDKYEEGIGLRDETGLRLFAENNDSNPRFHSDWCSMIYSRLLLARNLLAEDGVIFISLDDNEITNLKKMCDEIFGAINFIGQITVVGNPRGRDYGGIARMHDYILAYKKSPATVLNLIEDEGNEFKMFDALGGFELRELRNRNIKFNKENRPNLYYPFYINPNEKDENGLHTISLEPHEGWVELYPLESQGINTVWRWGKEKSANNLNINIMAKPMKNGSYMIVEKYRESKMMARSVWWDKDTNTEKGTLLVKDIMDGKVFDYPKPMEMLMRLCEMGTSNTEADIVMDFFSGSATTAHAVMKLNEKDSGNRRFIMVQLPEICDEASFAFQAGYKNICEIGKERIRRAGRLISGQLVVGKGQNGGDEDGGSKFQGIADMAKGHGDCKGDLFAGEETSKGRETNHSPLAATNYQLTTNHSPLDTGFRVFKLDESNMNNVYYSANEYSQDLLPMLESNVKADRTDLDLLFGCLLEWGLPLSLPYTSETIEGCTVHTYNDGDLIACFDENIPDSVIKTIAKRQPLRAVFRDSSFADSPSKINVGEVFKLLAPDTRVKVI